MNRRSPSCIAMLASLAACTGPGSPSPAGPWVGEARPAGAVDRLEIAIDSTATSATVSLRSWGLSGDTAGRLPSPPESLVFVRIRDRDTIRIIGAVERGTWQGMLARGADTGRFQARQLHQLTGDQWKAMVGVYRASDSGLVTIAPFMEFGELPMMVDHASGRIGPLYPVSPERLLVGAALVAPVFPVDSVDLAQGPDATVERLTFYTGEGATRTATRIATRDQEVRFANDSTTLAGTLTLPSGTPPFPALVLVHGSNALTRDVFGPWSRFFAAHGFAVLSYDKRGTGSSTGDWRRADFHALAGDVRAGVRFLAARGDVRRDRIGLWGASQAGWIMPIVAAELPNEIAFLVVHAGTGTTVREQGILNLRQELRAGGLPDSSVALGIEYRLLDDQVTEGRRGFADLERFHQRHGAANPWLWPPPPADSWFRPYYRMLMPFDPARYWQRVRCPVLLFFGEVDVNVPPSESWPPIDRALARGGNRQVTQVLLPNANHLFLEARTGGGSEYPGLSRFVPGYFDRMAGWLAERAR